MEKKKSVNYNRIYRDIIEKKFPNRKIEFSHLLSKEHLSALDVLKLNEQLFSDKHLMNGKHRSYREFDIKIFLEYQVKNQLSNTELANQFQLSRNSISKWKKLFP